MRSVYDYFQYFLLRCLALILNSFSPLTVERLSRAVASILFLRKRRRLISIANLRFAFPDKTLAEIKRIGRGSMAGMVTVIFEFLRIPTIMKDPFRYIEVEGVEHILEALKEGKGVILLASHFGNWELMGIATAAKGVPLYAIGRATRNPYVYRFIESLRGATGLRHVEQDGAVKKTVKLLRQNGIVAMLADERVKRGGIEISFFGGKTQASSLPAMLSLKHGTPVIPAFYYRNHSGGRAKVVFKKPFKKINSGNFKEDLRMNTQNYMNYLENEIRLRPEDWLLWMHNRWESVINPPPSSEDFSAKKD